MTDREIIAGLIARDERITKDFFFVKCRPLFCSVMQRIFNHEVDYDEMVNELYIYLMEDDAAKLRGFQYRSSVYQWLKVLSIRFVLKQRDRMIDIVSHETPYNGKEKVPAESMDIAAQRDIEHLLSLMPNARYAQVIRRVAIDGVAPEEVAKEMCITTDNLYNIKRRAMAQLTRIALKDIHRYGQRYGR